MTISKYAWYLRIVLKARLPAGFTREFTPKGDVVYHNQAEGITSK